MSFDRQLVLHALDEAADFIIVTDDTSVEENGPCVVYANHSFLRATGYSEDELIGNSINVFYSSKNAPRLRESIARALESGEPNAKEMLARRKDGSDFWLEFVAKPFHREGDRQYWLSIGRDISLRRQSLSQMALLFAAVEHTGDAVALYEPSPSGELELTYENEQSFRRGNPRLLSLWSGASPLAVTVRERLQRGDEVHEFFAELDRNGMPRLIQFNARAIRSDARLEGIVTLERTLTHGGDAPPENYESLLLRIAAVLPTIAAASNADERFAMLRAILLDAFDAELFESDAPLPQSVHIAAGANLARFAMDGRSLLVRWQRPLESTALTALRFCIEAAMEQSRLPQARNQPT